MLTAVTRTVLTHAGIWTVCVCRGPCIAHWTWVKIIFKLDFCNCHITWPTSANRPMPLPIGSNSNVWCTFLSYHHHTVGNMQAKYVFGYILHNRSLPYHVALYHTSHPFALELTQDKRNTPPFSFARPLFQHILRYESGRQWWESLILWWWAWTDDYYWSSCDNILTQEHRNWSKTAQSSLGQCHWLCWTPKRTK